MTENEFEDFRIKKLSPLFRCNYWTLHSNEPDATILWSGLRSEVGRWLACEFSVVIGALTALNEVETVASRSVFSRSLTLRDLWYYGYFYTLPNFRRVGLGERVLREGLAKIRAAGARRCSCYVADDNYASAELAIKLGFRRLPFVRVVFRVIKDITSDVVRKEPTAIDDIRKFPGYMKLIDEIVCGGDGAAVVMDELLVRKPWQPWKSPDSRLILLEFNKGSLGIGRIGMHKSVLLPDIDMLMSDPVGLLLSAVSAMRENQEIPVSAFLPRTIVESLQEVKRNLAYEVYDIYWHKFLAPIP